MQHSKPPTTDGSSNVIRFGPPIYQGPVPVRTSYDYEVAALLADLNAHSLQAVFSAMDGLQSALDQVEATQALLPDSPATARLRQEATRLSCELFSARMMAVRLSSTLGQLRRASAAEGAQADTAAAQARRLRGV